MNDHISIIQNARSSSQDADATRSLTRFLSYRSRKVWLPDIRVHGSGNILLGQSHDA